MKYELESTDDFRSDVDGIFYYISKVLCQTNAAQRIAAKINKNVLSLQEFPYAYPICESWLGTRNCRKLVVGNYIVIYTVNEETKTVTLINCVYARSDYRNRI